MAIRTFRAKSHQSAKQKMYFELARKIWVNMEGEYLFADDSVTQVAWN